MSLDKRPRSEKNKSCITYIDFSNTQNGWILVSDENGHPLWIDKEEKPLLKIWNAEDK